MTDDPSRPQDLEPLKQPLIESVIDAYMAKNVAGTGGLVFDHGSCAEGEFRFSSETDRQLEASYRYYCSYPDGQWKQDATFFPDQDMSPDDHADGNASLFDAKAKFEEIARVVSEWIDPFIAGHSPNEFNNQIAVLQNVINELYVQSEVRVGEKTIGGDSEPGTTTAPTGSVRSAIADIESDLEPLAGNAINNLKRNYTNDVGLTISGQRALATVAGLAIMGERISWSNTYSDLTSFYKNATSDFTSFAKSGGPDTAQTLTIVSGLTGIGAALTAPIAPLSAGLGVVSGVTGLASNYVPEPAEATIVTLRGGDFDTLWDSFKQGVSDINSELTEAEFTLHNMIQQALADYDANATCYSLIPARQFMKSDENSPESELYGGNSIQIVHPRMRSVAGKIEHIGDHQRTVAGKLSDAVNISEWSRGTLNGGSIGWGPNGHAASFELIVDTLTTLLLEESKHMHRLAEHCVEVSEGFKVAEAEVERTLDKLEARVR